MTGVQLVSAAVAHADSALVMLVCGTFYELFHVWSGRGHWYQLHASPITMV